MKKLLALPLSALFLTGCISLPSLSAENTKLVTDVSFYLCEADKAGLLKDNAELTQDQLKTLIEQVQANTNFKPSIPPQEIEQRINKLSDDPIQLGLFFKTLVEEQVKCRGASNTNA